jgi:hypothetical protein
MSGLGEHERLTSTTSAERPKKTALSLAIRAASIISRKSCSDGAKK